MMKEKEKHERFLIFRERQHRKAIWTEAKVSENNQSHVVNTTGLDPPVPCQGHMGRLQGE